VILHDSSSGTPKGSPLREPVINHIGCNRSVPVP
jgi:hypothetical protein